MPETPDLARIAYERYNEVAGGKTWDGKPIPAWDDLPAGTDEAPGTREKWAAAIEAVTSVLAGPAEASTYSDGYNPVSETRSLRHALDEVLQEIKGSPRKSRSRSMSITKIEEGVMWLGMDLKEMRESGIDVGPNPYPSSYDGASTAPIEPTADDLKLWPAMTPLALAAHLGRQRGFSLRTFGPGYRLDKVIAHLRKELGEVEKAPLDVTEYADLVLLTMDGAMRMGREPAEVAEQIARRRAEGRGFVVPGAPLARHIESIDLAIALAESHPGQLRSWIWLVLAIAGAAESVAGIGWDALWKAASDKLAVNEQRDWPDWRSAGDGPIEHVRAEAARPA